MEFLTREKIKNAVNVFERFEIEEWDGFVYIRKWSGAMRAQLLAKLQDEINSKFENPQKLTPEEMPKIYNVMVEIVATSICDENGVLIFDPTNPDDVKEVSEFNGDVLESLFFAAANYNKILEKNVKEEIKNSEAIQS